MLFLTMSARLRITKTHLENKNTSISFIRQLNGVTFSRLRRFLYTSKIVKSAIYFPNKSLCVPVRTNVRTKTSASIRYTKSQSGKIWHSLYPTQSPVSAWSLFFSGSASPRDKLRIMLSNMSISKWRFIASL